MRRTLVRARAPLTLAAPYLRVTSDTMQRHPATKGLSFRDSGEGLLRAWYQSNLIKATQEPTM